MTDKDNLLHLDGDSKKLFPDGWYVDKKKTSIVIQEFFTYSFFRTGKSEKRNKLRYNFPDGKFIETIGYVNSTDQQVFMIFLDYARHNYQSLKIGGHQYDRVVVIPRKEMLGILGHPRNKGSYAQMVMNSLKRLKSLVITHNLYKKLKESISFFSNVGYLENSKSFYFVISPEFERLHERLYLKNYSLSDYLELENSLARNIWLSLKILYDHPNSPKSRVLKLETILRRGGKPEWILKAEKKDYFKSKIKNVLAPALRELEEKGRFKFVPPPPSIGKYRLNSPYKVTRLYSLPRDEQEINSDNSPAQLGSAES